MKNHNKILEKGPDGRMDKMNELVKYSNFMNQIAFTKFTATDYNFLMTLCSKMRNQGTNEMVFSFKEIKKLANYSSKNTTSRFISDLSRMNQKMVHVSTTIETDDHIVTFILFPVFDINKKEQTLTVTVNERFRFILNELAGQFTEFDLKGFTLLESKYSKTLYRKLKQFRLSGFYTVKVDELRRIMDVPESYSNKVFMRDVINPAMKELDNYFKNLKVDIDHEKKRGNPISGFTFRFDRQVDNNELSNTITYKQENTKKGDEPELSGKKEKEVENAQNYKEMDEYLRKIAR